MFSVRHRGSFAKTLSMLTFAITGNYFDDMYGYGQQGVDALRAATPIDTGKTADSWNYKIERTMSGVTISWYNSEMAGDTPLAILLQYGHGTNRGGYVQGRDFINPALRPVFDKIAEEAWASLTKS
jgi:hypothetical protein